MEQIAKDWLESLQDGEGEYYFEPADVEFFKKIISTWLKNNGIVAGIYSVVINGTEFVPLVNPPNNGIQPTVDSPTETNIKPGG